jgi:hypothetical protein
LALIISVACRAEPRPRGTSILGTSTFLGGTMAGRPPNPRFVTAKEPAFFTFEGEDVVINPTEIYRADMAMVRAKPHLFKPIQATRPDVEQATAAPGEVRGM